MKQKTAKGPFLTKSLTKFLIVLTLGLLVFVFWDDLLISFGKSLSIAKVKEVSGHVEIWEDGQVEPTKAKRSFSIKTSSNITTHQDSDILIRTSSGAEFRINSNSEIHLSFLDFSSKKKPSLLILIKSGKIEIINPGPENHLQISENGHRYDANHYDPLIIKDEASIETEELTVWASDNEVEDMQQEHSLDSLPPPPDSLHENEKIPVAILKKNNAEDSAFKQMLASKIKAQKLLLYRCYTGLLQLEPTASGKVTIQFSVESSGRVSNLNIANSEFKSKTFHDCISDVLKRTEFSAFAGPAISTLFPLHFQKQK
jgi:hypothetical protein